MIISFALPRMGSAEVYQLDITGTVFMGGCPSPGVAQCAPYPLMWDLSGGETMTAQIIYDDESPLGAFFDSSPTAVESRYDHALPVVQPNGATVDFGPYSTVAGSSGAAAESFSISVFDDLESGCCPGLPELIAVHLLVAASTLTIDAPAGFHDLDLRAVRLEFLNYGGGGNLLNDSSLPPGFADFAWDEIRLAVDVFDPIYVRDGTALLTITSLQSTLVPTTPAVPGLSLLPFVALSLACIALRLTYA